MTLLLACACAYLLGGIPFGLVLVRSMKGVDIRKLGSGNVGATNASRAFGKRKRLWVFLLIYVFDFGKGFVPAAWFPQWFGIDDALLGGVLVGASAILGHCVSPYLGFKGGKGVATTTGVFAAVELGPVAIAVGVFLVVFVVTRQVFLGSLALGFALASAVVLREPATAFGERLPVSVLALALAVFLVYTHRGNLRRMRGEQSAEASPR